MNELLENIRIILRARHKLIIILSILTIGLTQITGQTPPISKSNNRTAPTTQTAAVAVDNTETKERPSQKTFAIVKVIDGDTVDVDINGNIERLRLIGINTPETVDPRKPVECFGTEASNKAKSLLDGARVVLKSDPSQGERDKYDRLLRYVFLEDGTNFNLLMIKEGYAHEYTYRAPYQYQAEFKQAQKEATANKIGLWGDVCSFI
jgi:micrococcal nuclease